MVTVEELLQAFGLPMPNDEMLDDDWLAHVERLKNTMGFKLNKIFGKGEMTGGADWSAAHVWRVPRVLEHVITPRANADAELFLIWDEGDLDEPLTFVERSQDEDGDFVIGPVYPKTRHDDDLELTPPLLRKLMLAAHVSPSITLAQVDRDGVRYR